MSRLTKTQVINEYILKNETLDDFLNNFKTASEQGFMYELICEFAFVFKQTNEFNYEIYFGDSDNLVPLKNMNINNYLYENAISGNKEGVADLKYLKNNIYSFKDII